MSKKNKLFNWKKNKNVFGDVNIGGGPGDGQVKY
jgi:hypothetical protein